MDDTTLRRWLWLHHGHQGQYGDDGEMQCAACLLYSLMDYKRDTMERLLEAAGKALNVQLTHLRADAAQHFLDEHSGDTYRSGTGCRASLIDALTA